MLPNKTTNTNAAQAAPASSTATDGGAGYYDNTYIEYYKIMSHVVCLKGILTMDDLRDDAEYRDVVRDIKGEMEKFGGINKIVVPRPT